MTDEIQSNPEYPNARAFKSVQWRGDSHTLMFEGAAHRVGDCAEGVCESFDEPGPNRSYVNGVGGDGHAICSCGRLSDHLPSGAARKRWHRTHKIKSNIKVVTPNGK